MYRRINSSSAEHREEKVPSMVIHSFFKEMRENGKNSEPSIAEGFDEVVNIGFEHFNPSGTVKDLALMRSFLV